MIREGTVVYIDDNDRIKSEKMYMADVIICGDKILKNRWSKCGTIGEPYLEQHVEDTHRILLDIWNEMGKGEKI